MCDAKCSASDWVDDVSVLDGLNRPNAPAACSGPPVNAYRMMKNFSIALPAMLADDAAPSARDARPVCLAGFFDATANASAALAGSTPDDEQIGAVSSEIKDWLRLCHTPGVPPAAVRRLLAVFGPPGEIFGASRAALTEVVPDDVADRLLGSVSAELARQIECTVAWAAEPGCVVLTLSEPAYPRALLTLGDAPPILYCRGDVRLANHMNGRGDADQAGHPGRPGDMTAAIVGSRRATPQGRDNAQHFARVLGEAGVTIVSGLAAGIDAAAHEGALATPGGTCAVVGTGADIVYPSRHRALAERIAERGLLLSAFPLGTPPRPEHFPRRNRLIAALARCTVVIEATTHSGSLITARLAGELGRDVLAVPGSIHAPQSRGCHVLIRDGATLAAAPEDVCEALGIVLPVTETRTDKGASGRTGSAQAGDRTRRGGRAGAGTRPAPEPRHAGLAPHPGNAQPPQGSAAGNACCPPPVHPTRTGAPAAPAVQAVRASPGTTAVLEALGYDPVNADTLCGRTGLSIAAVLAQLGALELDGRITRLPGGRFARLTRQNER